MIYRGRRYRRLPVGSVLRRGDLVLCSCGDFYPTKRIGEVIGREFPYFRPARESKRSTRAKKEGR